MTAEELWRQVGGSPKLHIHDHLPVLDGAPVTGEAGPVCLRQTPPHKTVNAHVPNVFGHWRLQGPLREMRHSHWQDGMLAYHLREQDRRANTVVVPKETKRRAVTRIHIAWSLWPQL